jgi:hypothetical protein
MKISATSNGIPNLGALTVTQNVHRRCHVLANGQHDGMMGAKQRTHGHGSQVAIKHTRDEGALLLDSGELLAQI